MHFWAVSALALLVPSVWGTTWVKVSTYEDASCTNLMYDEIAPLDQCLRGSSGSQKFTSGNRYQVWANTECSGGSISDVAVSLNVCGPSLTKVVSMSIAQNSLNGTLYPRIEALFNRFQTSATCSAADFIGQYRLYEKGACSFIGTSIYGYESCQGRSWRNAEYSSSSCTGSASNENLIASGFCRSGSSTDVEQASYAISGCFEGSPFNALSSFSPNANLDPFTQASVSPTVSPTGEPTLSTDSPQTFQPSFTPFTATPTEAPSTGPTVMTYQPTSTVTTSPTTTSPTEATVSPTPRARYDFLIRIIFDQLNFATVNQNDVINTVTQRTSQALQIPPSSINVTLTPGSVVANMWLYQLYTSHAGNITHSTTSQLEYLYGYSVSSSTCLSQNGAACVLPSISPTMSPTTSPTPSPTTTTTAPTTTSPTIFDTGSGSSGGGSDAGALAGGIVGGVVGVAGIAAVIWYFLKIREPSDKPILVTSSSSNAVEPVPMSPMSPASVSPAPGSPPEAEVKRESV